MVYEIKRFDLLTVFKVSFIVYLVVGFLLGLFYALILMKMMSTLGPLLDSPALDDLGSIGFFAAIMMAFFMAIFLAVIWSIITVISAAIYNVVAGMTGGLKLELSEVVQLYPPQMQPPPQINSQPSGGSTGV